MESDLLLDGAIALGVMFVVLQAVGAILSGTPSSNWTTGINQASSFVAIAFILLIVGYVKHLTKGYKAK